MKENCSPIGRTDYRIGVCQNISFLRYYVVQRIRKYVDIIEKEMKNIPEKIFARRC